MGGGGRASTKRRPVVDDCSLVKAPASQAVIGQKTLIHFHTAVLSVALRPLAIDGGSQGLFIYLFIYQFDLFIYFYFFQRHMPHNTPQHYFVVPLIYIAALAFGILLHPTNSVI